MIAHYELVHIRLGTSHIQSTAPSLGCGHYSVQKFLLKRLGRTRLHSVALYLATCCIFHGGAARP